MAHTGKRGSHAKYGDRRAHARLAALLPPSELPTFSSAPAPPPSRRAPAARLMEESGWTARLYLLCYGIGMFTVWVVRRLLHLLYIALTPVGQAMRRLWERLVRRPLRIARWEGRRVKYSFTLAGERLHAAAERGVAVAVVQALALPWMALRRHRRLLHGVFQAVLMGGATLLLIVVVRYWGNTTFALELIYGGQPIGYIADEAVFQNAVDMAEGRIIKTTEEHIIEREPHLTLRPVQQSAVLSETELCDTILKLSDSSVASMSGLYVDGAFEGALNTHDQLQGLLDEILAAYDTEADADNKTAEFMKKVEVVDGLYPLTAEETYEAMLTRLTARDEDGHPYLGVQIRCTEVYDEPIPFANETVKDATKYIGYSAVRVPGVEGVTRVTADVIYVNGEEQYREEISREVIREPVTQVTAEGSYRVNAGAQPGVATGTFLWPLPSCRTVYSPFGYRSGKLHAGIDISGNGVYGKDILAADGGRVSQVNASGWGSGYGLYVIIDHGNGYATVYAHCSEILVSEGDRVTQGQLIARVGNSGNSFGAHLHFEIRVNGTSVDPTDYV